MYAIQYTEFGKLKTITVKANDIIEACQKFTKQFPNNNILAAQVTNIYCNCTTFNLVPMLDSKLNMFVCQTCKNPISVKW